MGIRGFSWGVGGLWRRVLDVEGLVGAGDRLARRDSIATREIYDKWDGHDVFCAPVRPQSCRTTYSCTRLENKTSLILYTR